MELHQAKYFLAVCEARNFTRAAERCKVSQPALTAGIKKLENELDGPLFHRDRSGPKLTPLGERLFPHFRRLLDESTSILGLADDHRRLKSVPVRLGVLTTVGPSRIAEFFEQFRLSAPAAELEIEVEEHARLLARVEEGDLEIAITNVSSPRDWMVIKELYQEAYLVLLPPEHPLCQRSAVELSELSGEPYIDRTSCELRDMILKTCADRNVELYANYRTEREAWVECLVRAGVGFAFMPEHSVISPQSCVRPLVEPRVNRSISLVRSADHQMSPSARLFWDTLIASSRGDDASDAAATG